MKKILFVLLLFITVKIFAQNYPMITPVLPQENVPRQTTTQRPHIPRLSWEGQTRVTAGSRNIYTLRAADWNAALPESAFFLPVVPQGVILTPVAVTPEERANGVVMKLQIIALAPGNVNLVARVLRHENTRFDIPVLNIVVD